MERGARSSRGSEHEGAAVWAHRDAANIEIRRRERDLICGRCAARFGTYPQCIRTILEHSASVSESRDYIGAEKSPAVVQREMTVLPGVPRVRRSPHCEIQRAIGRLDQISDLRPTRSSRLKDESKSVTEAPSHGAENAEPSLTSVPLVTNETISRITRVSALSVLTVNVLPTHETKTIPEVLVSARGGGVEEAPVGVAVGVRVGEALVGVGVGVSGDDASTGGDGGGVDDEQETTNVAATRVKARSQVRLTGWSKTSPFAVCIRFGEQPRGRWSVRRATARSIAI